MSYNSVNDMFPSKYIKASDLQGQNVTVIIDRITKEEVGKDKDICPVVYFQGKQKGFVLNKTNANGIAKSYGQNPANWVGKQITIAPAWTDFNGESVECIRVRPQLPANYQAVQVPNGATRAEVPPVADMAAFDDEVPF